MYYIAPRWHQRSHAFLNNYNELEEITKQNSDFSKNSFDKNVEIYKKLKTSYLYYWKLLRDLLKEQGIINYYPVEILKLAQQKGFINDADIWIEFNNHRRVLTEYSDHDFIIMTLNKFIPIMKASYKNVKIMYDEYAKKHDLIYDRFDAEDAYPNNRPDYCPESLNLSLKNYSKLLQFFITHKEIKRVWFFGSMSINPREGADIDLLMDAPKEIEASIKEELNKLRILNRIDIHCYRTLPKDKKELHPYKIVYRAIDFQ